MTKTTKKTLSNTVSSSLETFTHRALIHGLGLLGLLITLCFFTATYDSAQVKLTLLQMGAITLIFLWGTVKMALKKNPFTKERLPFLLPVLIYIGWNLLCYTVAPYHLEAAEEFTRFMIYGAITLLAATELKAEDLPILTKYIIVAAWISFLYAGLQVVNIFWPGADPVNWHGFFTKRVFATHANPNFFADFVVFSSCIIGAAFAISRKKSLLVLLVLGAVCLFFTESKGAWGAYALAAAFAVFTYTNTQALSFKKHLKKINLAALAGVLTAALLVSYFTTKRFQSVSFRMHTWLATVEMIKDSPIFGIGTGNFKVIYSAYKRPQIFYIEQAHNVETQHPENELLEQAAVSGILGLAIFLWLVGFLLYAAWKRLKEMSSSATSPDVRLYLLGYTTAFAAMFIHSLVDVSIRFTSSGFFFALFMGMILALVMPVSTQKDIPHTETPTPWYAHLCQFVLAGLWLTVAILIILQFREITAPLVLHTWSEIVLLGISWLVLCGALLGAGYISIRSACLMKHVLPICLLCLVPPLLYGSFTMFRANHYYSLAITFTQLRKNDGAIIYFTRAIQGNPFQVEYRQFRANLLAATLQLTQTFAPNRGDTKTASNDFERALRDFEAVEKASPNHPLLHHNRGQLYYVMALRRSDEATHARNDGEYNWLKTEALSYMAQAKKSFQRALKSDPVNEETYAFLIQIGLLENNLDEAQTWIDRYYQGPDGVTESEFLDPLKQNPRMQLLQQQIIARRAQGSNR